MFQNTSPLKWSREQREKFWSTYREEPSLRSSTIPKHQLRRVVACTSSIQSSDGLSHVGGRLRKASLLMESKHLIILPKEDHVTWVIIGNYHRACGHSSREHVLASVRQKFWINQGSSTARSVLEKCVSCRCCQAILCQQKMADLPESCVLAEKPTFTSVGMDYFGPFQVRCGWSLLKRYAVIFTSGNPCYAPRNCTQPKHTLILIGFAMFHCKKRPSEGNLHR